VTEQEKPSFDSEYLLNLARQKTAESRSALATTISDLFENDKGALTDRERALMFEILRNIILDVEQSVRKGLSEHLAGVEEIPLDLINILANDEIEVAYPMLTKSKIFRDMDLIEVVQQRTMEHQMAVAIREDVSEQISDALVETGEEGVMRTLLNNPNAAISQKAMAYMVEQSRRVDSFQEPIINRKELSPKLAERMFMWVSAALRQYIIRNFEFDDDYVDDLMEKVAAQNVKSNGTGKDKDSSKELAQSLEEEGLVTNEMLLKALSQGEVPLFISLFCRRSSLGETLVTRILFEPGGEGLAIACRALDIDAEQFSEIFTLSRKSRPGVEEPSARELWDVRNFYTRMSQKSTLKVLKAWQRDTDYQAAIGQLKFGR